MNMYVPAKSEIWSSPAPTTIQEGLDRIASLLYSLNKNQPIP